MAARHIPNQPSGRIEPLYQPLFAKPTTPNRDQSSFLRPLSDIREITEPSIVEFAPPNQSNIKSIPRSHTRQPSLKQAGGTKRANSVRIVEPTAKGKGKQRPETHFSSSTTSDEIGEGSSAYSIPAGNIPPRASSRNLSSPQNPSNNEYLIQPTPAKIRDRGRSDSPVRLAAERQAHLLVASEKRVPSQTLVRSPCPFDLVDQPVLHHNRISAKLQVVAPLFVGGGSVEGSVRMAIDEGDRTRQRHSMLISQISVDILGVEELLGQHRRSVFLALGTDLLTVEHPPSPEMVQSTIPLSYSDCHWILKPSINILPFRLSLPLDVGPAPFRSKTACIRYLLAVTVRFSEAARPMIVRNSENIAVLSTYDPERALRSLPSPLTAFDEIHMAKSSRVDIIRLTAGLHRQVWVSGTSIFVDIHVANESRKHLKRLDLSIERDTLYYKHSAAATLEKSASQARIFQDKEQTLLSKTTLKAGTAGWHGVAPGGNVIRTCDIDVPRGHATVRCGKYFEVRYFLNVTIGTLHIKLLSVQLPIILIHMNSLDVVPNAVGQVAVAIEEKRAQHFKAYGRRFNHESTSEDDPAGQSGPPTLVLPKSRSKPKQSGQLQGKAFAAPRQQSLDRMRAQRQDIERLGDELERSPRRYHRPDRRHQSPPARRPQVRPHVPPKDTPPASNQDRYRHGHKFALHSSSSQTSLGGVSVGSYTVLNGSKQSIPPSAHPARSFPPLPPPGIGGTVRRTIRNMRSFDSFRRQPSSHRRYRSSSSSHDYTTARSSHAQPHSQVQPLMLGLHDARSDLQHPARSRRDCLHDASSDNEGPLPAQRRKGSRPRSASVASGREVMRRASFRLRDSFDKGRFEFASAVGRSKGRDGREGGMVGGFKGWLGKVGKRGEGEGNDEWWGNEDRRDNAGWENQKSGWF